MKILVVEDEIRVASFIRKGLEEFGYETDLALDAAAAEKLLALHLYATIILDVNLPKVSGIDLCRTIRKGNPTVPILMLTALGSTDDKLSGFDAGADDYLVKPFDFLELVARIRSLQRRSQVAAAPPEAQYLRMADLEMNLTTRTVRRGNQKIDLTAREYALLEYFLRNPTRALSRLEIASHVWDVSFDTGTNVVDVYINYLRRKIDREFTPKLIHTVTGTGYILKVDAETP
ncbi:MAG: response regulator transcription factor [Cytophagales bacterium]|nr:response regulator transcription factor [Cytophagales bacterium]